MDSGAEKDVIRQSVFVPRFPHSPDYQVYSPNLFVFPEELEAFNFGDVLEANADKV